MTKVALPALSQLKLAQRKEPPLSTIENRPDDDNCHRNFRPKTAFRYRWLIVHG